MTLIAFFVVVQKINCQTQDSKSEIDTTFDTTETKDYKRLL